MRRLTYGFDRAALPSPADYFRSEGMDLPRPNAKGWCNVRCVFHDDKKPSLGVNLRTGAFRCHACDARGGDVVAFHMRRHDLGFVEAARALGAWVDDPAIGGRR